MGEVSAGIPAKPSERQSTDPVPTRAQPAERPADHVDSETGPPTGRVPAEPLVLTRKRMSCQTPVIPRGPKPSVDAKGEVQRAVGDLRPV